MRLFWKIYCVVFIAFAAVIALSSYVTSAKRISDAEKSVAEEHRIIGSLIASEIERRQSESKWPFESLKRLSGHHDFIFWWIVKEDGIIHLADKASFVGLCSYVHFPRIEGMSPDDEVLLNSRQNYGLFIKSFRVGKHKWTFWLGFSTKHIAQANRKIILSTIIYSVSALVILGLVLYFVIVHFLRPVKNLTIGVEKIGKGELDYRVEVKSNDELGYLAHSFNKMSGDLKRTTTSINNLNREIAERKKTETRISHLNHLKEELLAPLAIGEKGKRITDALVKIFDADFARIWIIKPGDLCSSGCVHAEVKDGPHICQYRDRCLHLLASSGRYTHIDGKVHRRVPFGCYKIGRVAAGTDTKFITNDVTHDQRVHDRDWAKRLGLVSFAGYRLISTEGTMLETLANTTSQVIQTTEAEEKLQKSEEKYKTLLENLPQRIFLKDRDSVYVSCNQNYARDLKIKPEEIAGRTDYEFYDKELAEKYRADDKRIMEAGRTEDMAEAELKAAQEKLIETARAVGMAEVAADVLHNVGNVLNSINVSTTVIREKVTSSELANLEKVASIINEHTDDLGTFLTEDPQGKHIPVYLTEVSKCLTDEQTDIIDKLKVLTDNVQHIKDIIGMQQSYAKVSGVEVPTSLSKLAEDAIQINSAGLERHGTRLIREFEDLGDVEIDKQKVLQILVNLVSNAKYALSGCDKEEKLLTIRIYKHSEERFRIEVADNGVGISEDNLAKIFSHGFTTKKNGHGFGLHSSALAAEEIGGSLTVHSDGMEQGATFTLELPFKPVEVIK